MEINCGIVKDLVPLYHDEVCSDETKAAVEEHIAHCSECRAALESLSRTEYMEETCYSEARSRELAESYRKLRRRNSRRMALTVALAVIGAVLIAIGFIKYYIASHRVGHNNTGFTEPSAGAVIALVGGK